MAVTSVRDNHELMIISQEGTVIRVPVESVRTTGRNTMGVRVMNLRGADKVSTMARVVATSGGNGDGPDAGPYDDDLVADLAGSPGLETYGPQGLDAQDLE
ncbi:MAG: hypothetical protein A2W26_13210 [Acidobacteria bacterium RBG_16_64_8]|nr:MAG: hypothetical protein A2W26_13210 [Acidobacteria bacterium RBG_16_64_8]